MSKMHRVATMTMTVTFEVDSDECVEVDMDPKKVLDGLVQQFEQLPSRISGDGMLTYDLPATAEWSSEVRVHDV